MLFILLLALWALLVGRINVTKNFRITEKRARLYGLTLLLAVLPFRWVASTFLAVVLPDSWLQNGVIMAVFNAMFLVAFVLALALPFRDRGVKPVTPAV